MTLLLSGLSLGAVYALVGIGYNVVFQSSRTFNFAHAQLIMIGTFVAYTTMVTFELGAVAAVVLCVLAVAAVAAVEEPLVVRPVRDSLEGVLVTTLGASILLDGVSQVVWGTQPLRVPFVGPGGVVDLLGGRVYPVELALICLVIVLVVGFAVLSRRTLLGIALMAMAEDREAAVLRGVDVRRMAFGAFVVTGALAGLAGLFVGPKTFAFASLGAALALKGFVVIALGGFGSMPGALVGGAVVGLVEATAIRYLGSAYGNLSVFLVLITVLMLRPSGLFGKVRERVV